MSLQFIFGNSGSGKSTYLYQKIIEESMQRPDGNFIVIVPEQSFTGKLYRLFAGWYRLVSETFSGYR